MEPAEESDEHDKEPTNSTKRMNILYRGFAGRETQAGFLLGGQDMFQSIWAAIRNPTGVPFIVDYFTPPLLSACSKVVTFGSEIRPG